MQKTLRLFGGLKRGLKWLEMAILSGFGLARGSKARNLFHGKKIPLKLSSPFREEKDNSSDLKGALL
ncbi:MAG: hypothetical protein LBO66_13550 [Deltaproteobacteria bacterium]|nr:hypothetical protein [Deltaproteobacteria bacterium]